jgi:hypothetical protein
MVNARRRPEVNVPIVVLLNPGRVDTDLGDQQQPNPNGDLLLVVQE